MTVKSRLYLTELVENKNPRAKADTLYNVAIVVFEDGREEPALFTDFDIEKAVKRAAANREDIPAYAKRKPWWKRLFGR